MMRVTGMVSLLTISAATPGQWSPDTSMTLNRRWLPRLVSPRLSWVVETFQDIHVSLVASLEQRAECPAVLLAHPATDTRRSNIEQPVPMRCEHVEDGSQSTLNQSI